MITREICAATVQPCKRLFGPEAGMDFVPNYADLRAERRSVWCGAVPASHCQIA